MKTWDWSRIAKKVLPSAFVFVVCLVAVTWHVAEYRHLGPLDEQAHLDYVNRLLAGDLPVLGQKLTDETRGQVACRGLETPTGFGDHPNCNRFRTDKTLPEEANSYEAGQPPLYYGVTAVASRIMPGDDIDAIRHTGGLWLGVGAIALLLTLRRLRVALGLAIVVSLVFALAPPLLFAASTVSNDIAVWTFGAVALWAVVGLMQAPSLRYPHLIVGGLIGAVAGLVKPSALLIVAALAGCLLLQQWWKGQRRWGLLLAASMLGGAVLSTGIWGLVVTNVAHRPIDQVAPWARYRVSHLNVDQLLKQPLFNLVSVYRAFIPAAWRADWVVEVLFEAALYLQVGLLLLPLLGRWPEDETRSIGVMYLAAVAVSGPYYVVVYFAATHILYGADTRFAFGLIPLLAVVLATWVPYSWQRWLLTSALALPVLWYGLIVTGAVTASLR